jgi:hypothetical protein
MTRFHLSRVSAGLNVDMAETMPGTASTIPRRVSKFDSQVSGEGREAEAMKGASMRPCPTYKAIQEFIEKEYGFTVETAGSLT